MKITYITDLDLPLACRPGHPHRRDPTLEEVANALRSIEEREAKHRRELEVRAQHRGLDRAQRAEKARRK